MVVLLWHDVDCLGLSDALGMRYTRAKGAEVRWIVVWTALGCVWRVGRDAIDEVFVGAMMRWCGHERVPLSRHYVLKMSSGWGAEVC